MKPSARVLVAMGDARLRRAVAKLLSARAEVVTCETEDAARTLVRTARPEAALVDASLATPPLVDALGGAPVVVANALGSTPLAEGVFVALPPGTDAELLALAASSALETAAVRARAARAESRVGSELGEIVAASKTMRALVAKARRASSSRANVLVAGEPGTGKELLARAALAAPSAPIIDASIDAEGAGAELVRALAETDRMLVLHAERLPADARARLLAALSSEASPRVVATASTEMRDERGAGRLLYVRLSTILLEVPPLRARRDDIPVLATHLLKRQPNGEGLRFSVGAMKALRAHDYPANVAELEAAVVHAAAVARGDTIGASDLPFGEAKERAGHPIADEPYAAARLRALSSFEHAYVAEAIRRAGGNLAQAARIAGMDRANFRRLAKRSDAR